MIEDVINVKVGGAEGFAAVDSPDEEVTPDTPPAPAPEEPVL